MSGEMRKETRGTRRGWGEKGWNGCKRSCISRGGESVVPRCAIAAAADSEAASRPARTTCPLPATTRIFVFRRRPGALRR